MIKQPEKGTRDVTDLFYEAERKRIEMLNNAFFRDVELTEEENRILIWLCGWDTCTINVLVKAFRKVKGVEK